MGILRLVAAAAVCFTTIYTTVSFAKEMEAVPGEYLVKVKPGYENENLKSVSELLGTNVVRAMRENHIYIVQHPVIETPISVVKKISQNPMVELVEPNYIYRANRTPNDMYFGKLWGLKNFGQTDSRATGTPGVDIDAERAWDVTTGSDDVLVAVIDTGVDYNHADLRENIWTNEAEANGAPGVDDDNNGIVDDIHGANFVDAAKPTGNPMDDHGHGSHCSGTIGGRGDDGNGIVGVNWHVKILAAKFLGGDGGGTLEGAIKAIDYATRMGAKIMSNSWGGGSESALLREAIERSHAAGALFVVAAGNDAANNDSSPHFPSNYTVPNVLSVAAIDNKGQLATFSNFGKKSVHVAAPGVNIFSSVVGGYDSWSGTSMATPHVTGVAALLAAQSPELTNLQLKQRIISTVKPLAGVRGKVSSGGMVNAYYALMNEQAPPDMNDPDRWQSKPLSISSAHPYAKNSKQTFEVSVPGATEMALYFAKLDTEKNYDKVTLMDASGKVIATLSGSADESYSPTIAGNYVQIVFTSDNSVEKYGFDLTKVSYR